MPILYILLCVILYCIYLDVNLKVNLATCSWEVIRYTGDRYPGLDSESEGRWVRAGGGGGGGRGWGGG